MNDSYEKFECWVRFLNLSEGGVKKLKTCYPAIEDDLSKNRDGTGYVASVEITENGDLEWIHVFINDIQVRRTDFDVYIAVLSEYDERTYEVPSHVLDFVSRSKSRMVFTFTCI